METENQETKVDDSLKQKARARLREMRQTVRTTTEAIGLPPEAEGAVATALYDERSTDMRKETSAGHASGDRPKER